MRLIINREDIIKAFVAKTGYEAHEIEIEEESYARIETPKSLANADVRMAIATIFDEAMTVQDQYREGRDIIPNKISLIKAIRVIIPNTGLKDAKDYVENILLKENF